MKKIFAMTLMAFAINTAYADSIQQVDDDEDVVKLDKSDNQVVGVSPMSFDFKKSNIEILYLSNSSDETKFYEVIAFKWTPQGLEKTRDLIVTPPLSEIPPYTKQTVKILHRVAKGEAEGTYRLAVTDRGNPNSKDQSEVLLAMILPMFVPSNNPDAKADISVKFNGNKVVMVNKGNKTAKLTKITADGKEHEANFYVLPNSEAELPQEYDGAKDIKFFDMRDSATSK